MHFGPHYNSTLGRWLVILLDIMLVDILLLLDELLLEQDQHCKIEQSQTCSIVTNLH